MKVKELCIMSARPFLEIGKDMRGYVEQILKEDIPASIIIIEDRQNEPIQRHLKRYGWFGSEKTIGIGSVPKKRVKLMIEYSKPRDIENAYQDFKRIEQIMMLSFWCPEVILDGMNFLTGKWRISAQSDSSKKITDTQPSNSIKATVTLWGLIDSNQMRQTLTSLADQIYEPVKTGRHNYTTEYGGGSCNSYPPQLKLSKSWEEFSEVKLSYFFQKVQEFSESHHLTKRWFRGYARRRMILPDDECFEMLYKLDLLKKTYLEKRIQTGYKVYDYPMLEVTAKLWRNSNNENGARCFFTLNHESIMTAYWP